MNAAITKAELARLLPEPGSREAGQVQGLFHAVLRARDALHVTGLPQVFARLAGRIRARRAVCSPRARG